MPARKRPEGTMRRNVDAVDGLDGVDQLKVSEPLASYSTRQHIALGAGDPPFAIPNEGCLVDFSGEK